MDQFLTAADAALRTLFADPIAAERSPATGIAEADLSDEQRKLSAALMRVNHVGEVCAQALYSAQAMVTKDAQLREHLLHAARYTALGDDLEFRHGPISAEAGPAGIRDQARALSGALFHISLHGYPAHEWLRPLNGYLPRGYEDWTLPRGFRLILRHHPGWAAPARRLIEGVAARLGQLPGLTDFNHAQIALAQRLGVGPGEMIGGFSCRLDENARMPLPLVLVTDYPDETLSGEAFIAAHEAQRAATIAAYEAFQDLDSWDWPLA